MKSKSSTAWIVSDDARLRSELGSVLSDEVSCDVTQSGLSQWAQGEIPLGSPEYLFLDLRDNGSSEQVLRMRQEDERWTGDCVPVIGIVEQGYPRECATLADQTLTAALPWPCASSLLPSLMSDAQTAAVAKSRYHPGECRVLESETRRFVTYTPAMFPLFDNLEVAAKHDFTILLVGETGTGKTTLAGMIHEVSSRRAERFVTVPCGAMPNDLIDSELFGHVRGAFTGADKNKSGKFSAAERGTILLDEIDVLGQLQQVKLLRVLETGEFEPVGSNETKTNEAKIVVASNVNLEELMAANCFRPDLYFRLNQVKFELPPLRERPLDIVPMAIDFIDDCCRENDLSVRYVHPDFLDVLKSYSWPGNIRELRNEVRRAVLFAQDGVVTPAPLSPAVLEFASKSAAAAVEEDNSPGLATEVAQTERGAIEEMLRAKNFNRAATARALGISRVTLYNKIRKYRISVETLDISSDQ